MFVCTPSQWFTYVAIIPLMMALYDHPEDVFSNAVVTRVGYPGWCVGFDAAPGNYAAAILWQLVIYTGFLHVHWKLARVLISQDDSILLLTWKAKAYIITANVLWLVGTMLAPISFMVSPVRVCPRRRLRFALSQNSGEPPLQLLCNRRQSRWRGITSLLSFT